jgi:hypothetical protein
VVEGDDVVQVPDGGVAVGGAAGVVPGLDEAAEPVREDPGAGVHRDEFAGARMGVEPAKPDGKSVRIRIRIRIRIGNGAGTGTGRFTGRFTGSVGPAGSRGTAGCSAWFSGTGY